MKTNKLAVFGYSLALGLVSFTVACGDGNTPPGSDDSGEAEAGEGEEGDTGDSSDSSSTGGDDCHAPIDGGLPDGELCVDNGDCESNFCLGYSDAPADPEATCEPAPAMCRTRTVGQVLEFGTNGTVAGATVRVVGAIGASVNPVGATAHAEGTTDEMGRFDLTTANPLEEPLGIVGIVQGDGYHLSATGLASPLGSDSNAYGPANTIRDVWAVPTDTLAGWNTALEGDASLAEYLPLGDKGGVIGLARSAETGAPVAGITMESTNGDASNALIRYLNEAGNAFDAAETSSNGVFIIVNPGLGENFDALMGGEPTSAATGTAGSTNNSLFILIMGV